MTVLKTERLLLRPWRPTDREPFARLNGDPETMEWMLKTLSREESDAMVGRIEGFFAEQGGWGFWAVEAPHVAPFIGMIGLGRVKFMNGEPVEIGWRLLKEYWGHGYAVEGAQACLRFGFETLHLPEIIAFTVPANQRSRRVMEKLHMTRDLHGDFEHPWVPEGHRLRRHVLYRLTQKEWASQIDS